MVGIIKRKGNRCSIRSQMMQSTGWGRVGCQLSQNCVFPRHKEIARWWKTWPVLAEGSSGLTHLEMAFPITRTAMMASSDKAPRVSTTIGTKSIPEAQQSDRWAASLSCTPTFRAWPGVGHALNAAAKRLRSWRGKITWITRAAGWLLCHVGRRLSAGLE